MSEHLDEPGTMMPNEFGMHLVSRFLIKAFQIDTDLKMKLCLDKSRVIFGTSMREFKSYIGPSENSSYIEMGVLYLTILNNSIKVC